MINKEENVEIIIFDSIRPDQFPIDIEYSLSQKLYKNVNKKVFICYIVCNQIIKISNYYQLLFSQEVIVDKLISQEENINKDNSILYTIFDFKKGFKLFPDMAMYNVGMDFKHKIESSRKIFLGGVIAVLNEEYALKYRKAIIHAANFLTKGMNYRLAGNYNESLKFIENEFITRL